MIVPACAANGKTS